LLRCLIDTTAVGNATKFCEKLNGKMTSCMYLKNIRLLCILLAACFLPIWACPQHQQQQQFSFSTQIKNDQMDIFKRYYIEKMIDFGKVIFADSYRSPVENIMEYLRKLLEKVQYYCMEISNWKNTTLKEPCREDLSFMVCSFSDFLNGTATKLAKLCDSLPDDAKVACVEESNQKIYSNLWVIKVVDSIGKLPSGIFQGNLLFLGSYEECLDISVSRNQNQNAGEAKEGTFQGKHCSIMIHLPRFHMNTIKRLPFAYSNNKLKSDSLTEPPLQWGICMPKTCSAVETTKLSDLTSQVFFFQILFIQFLNKFFIFIYVINWFSVYPNASSMIKIRCEEPQALEDDAGSIVMVVIGCALAFLVIVGSAMDFWYQYKSDTSKKVVKNSHSSKNNLNIVEFDMVNQDGASHHANAVVEESYDWKKCVILSFSIPRNLSELQLINPDHIQCIDGIRVLSVCYAIFGFSVLFAMNNIGKRKKTQGNSTTAICISDNALQAMDMISKFYAQIINSAALAADSFFVLSGFLVCYLFLNRAQLHNALDPMHWVLFYIRRAIRLVPVYVVLLGFVALLFKHVGDGPLWTGSIPSFSSQLGCESSCSPRVALAATSLLMISFAVLHAVIVVLNDYPPSYVATTNFSELEKLDAYVKNVFVKPYSHCCSYLVGIALGYFIYKMKNKPYKFSKRTRKVLWIVSLLFNATTVFGIYDYAKGAVCSAMRWSSTAKGLYACLSRLSWPITIAMIIMLCLNSKNCMRLFFKLGRIVFLFDHIFTGFVNRWLSMRMWKPLSRLSYCAALIHPMITATLLLTLRESFHVTICNVIYNAVSVTCITYLVALVVYLCLEAPLSKLRIDILSYDNLADSFTLKI
ncbi:Nose resistant to fluoxetine protein 6, partial [Trichinella spiralis]